MSDMAFEHFKNSAWVLRLAAASNGFCSLGGKLTPLKNIAVRVWNKVPLTLLGLVLIPLLVKSALMLGIERQDRIVHSIAALGLGWWGVAAFLLTIAGLCFRFWRHKRSIFERVDQQQLISKQTDGNSKWAVSSRNLPSISCFGLQSMRRRFIQLTTDFDYANAIAEQHGGSPVVFQVSLNSAIEAGVRFYWTPSHVWLSTPIPYDCLAIWMTQAPTVDDDSFELFSEPIDEAPYPLYIGDPAFEYVGEMFCSTTCCRKSRGW